MKNLAQMLEDIRKVLPEVWGIAVVDEEGFPIDYALARHLEMEDPIILGGLLASAVDLMERLLGELADSSLKVIYSKGDKLIMVAGKVTNGSFTLLADTNVNIGPLLMLFREYKAKIEEFMRNIV
ncbi:MAG: hypothetical protein GXO39_08610 [Thermotogae bacterium]|nr:hypothetical protein [Thermotogota bacterium]